MWGGGFSNEGPQYPEANNEGGGDMNSTIQLIIGPRWNPVANPQKKYIQHTGMVQIWLIGNILLLRNSFKLLSYGCLFRYRFAVDDMIWLMVRSLRGHALLVGWKGQFRSGCRISRTLGGCNQCERSGDRQRFNNKTCFFLAESKWKQQKGVNKQGNVTEILNILKKIKWKGRFNLSGYEDTLMFWPRRIRQPIILIRFHYTLYFKCLMKNGTIVVSRSTLDVQMTSCLRFWDHEHPSFFLKKRGVFVKLVVTNECLLVLCSQGAVARPKRQCLQTCSGWTGCLYKMEKHNKN